MFYDYGGHVFPSWMGAGFRRFRLRPCAWRDVLRRDVLRREEETFGPGPPMSQMH
jgi:hypothetical protein